MVQYISMKEQLYIRGELTGHIEAVAVHMKTSIEVFSMELGILKKRPFWIYTLICLVIAS